MRRTPVAGIWADRSDNGQTDQYLATFIFLKALSSVSIFGDKLNWLKMGVSGWALVMAFYGLHRVAYDHQKVGQNSQCLLASA